MGFATGGIVEWWKFQRALKQLRLSINELAEKIAVDDRTQRLTRWLNQSKASLHPQDGQTLGNGSDAASEDGISDEEVYFGDRTENILIPGQIYYTGNGGQLTHADLSLMHQPRTWVDPPAALGITGVEGPHFQPQVANDAIARFEGMCKAISPASREATWGTKPMSTNEDDNASNDGSAVIRGSFLKRLSFGRDSSSPSLHRPKILTSLRQFVPRVKGLLKRTHQSEDDRASITSFPAPRQHQKRKHMPCKMPSVAPLRPDSASFVSISSGISTSTGRSSSYPRSAATTIITVPSPTFPLSCGTSHSSVFSDLSKRDSRRHSNHSMESYGHNEHNDHIELPEVFQKPEITVGTNEWAASNNSTNSYTEVHDSQANIFESTVPFPIRDSSLSSPESTTDLCQPLPLSGTKAYICPSSTAIIEQSISLANPEQVSLSTISDTSKSQDCVQDSAFAKVTMAAPNNLAVMALELPTSPSHAAAHSEATSHRVSAFLVTKTRRDDSAPLHTAKQQISRGSPAHAFKQVGSARIRIELLSLFDDHHSRSHDDDHSSCDDSDFDSDSDSESDSDSDAASDDEENDGGSTRQHGGNVRTHTGASPSQGTTVTMGPSGSGSSNQLQLPRRGSGGRGDKDDDGSGDRRKRKRKRSGIDAPDGGLAAIPRLACPYQAYEPWQDCFRRGPRNPKGGCDGIYRLRQHFNRRHKLSHRCRRCWKAFENKADAAHHESEMTCDMKPQSPNERFMDRELEAEVDRSYGAMSEEEIWWDLFRILIPGMRGGDLSRHYSPYYVIPENAFMIPALNFSDVIFQQQPMQSPALLSAGLSTRYNTAQQQHRTTTTTTTSPTRPYDDPPSLERLLLTSSPQPPSSIHPTDDSRVSASPITSLLPTAAVGASTSYMDFLSSQPLSVPLFQALPSTNPPATGLHDAAPITADNHPSSHSTTSHYGGTPPSITWTGNSPTTTAALSAAVLQSHTHQSHHLGSSNTGTASPSSPSDTMATPGGGPGGSGSSSTHAQLARNHERLRQRAAQIEADNADLREASRETRSDIDVVDGLLEDILASGEGLPQGAYLRLSQMSEVLMKVKGRLR